MENIFRAQLLASAITANCVAYCDGKKSRAAWHAEQERLWRKAERARLEMTVMRLVCPPLAVTR